MQQPTFITGNQKKADYLAKWLGLPVQHRKVDLDEIQSLDLRTVVEHKVRQAYAIAARPVLVEDISLVFPAMGKLPGPLIRWFLEELGNDGIVRLVDGLGSDRTAVASIMYGLYDGHELHTFEAQVRGTVPTEARGEGFGWNAAFIPDGSPKTYAQMTDDELEQFGHRYQAIQKLRAFLEGRAS